MKELNILGNRIFELSIDSSIADNLKNESMQAYHDALNVSAGYPETSNVYVFRTPICLIDKPIGPGYQFQISKSDSLDSFIELVRNNLYQVFNKQFKVNDCWILLQTQEPWIQNEIHQHLTADYISVCYLNLNEGDSIEFFDDAGNSEKYYPKIGTVLIFNSAVKHKPNANTGSIERISLNLELSCEEVDQELLEISQLRFNTCKQCDQLNSLNICNKCMCFIPFKIRIKGAQCPLNKWQS